MFQRIYFVVILKRYEHINASSWNNWLMIDRTGFTVSKSAGFWPEVLLLNRLFCGQPFCLDQGPQSETYLLALPVTNNSIVFYKLRQNSFSYSADLSFDKLLSLFSNKTPFKFSADLRMTNLHVFKIFWISNYIAQGLDWNWFKYFKIYWKGEGGPKTWNI